MKTLVTSLFLILLLGCGKKKPQSNPNPPTKPEPANGVKAPPAKPKTETKKPGTVIWEFETGGEVVSSPAIGSDGTVYVGSQWDNKVYAINPDGTKKWEFKTAGRIHSSPAVGTDGTICIGSFDNRLYALDGKTGAKKWEFETGAYVYSSPVIGENGTLYIGSVDNRVYAIATSSKGPAKSPWPMFGQNAQRTGRAPKK